MEHNTQQTVAPSDSRLPKISFVVTTYNIANMVGRCLQILLKQSLAEIEIVVVDDMSSDETWQKLQEFAREDARIRLFQNAMHSGGPSLGRNTGILQSRGEYVCFVDGDDYLSCENAAEIMYNKMSESGADIGLPGWRVRNEAENHLEGMHDALRYKRNPRYFNPFLNRNTGEADFHFSEASDSFWLRFHPASGSKIYLREFLLQEQLFYEDMLVEDFYYSVRSYFLARKILRIDEPLYTVCVNRDLRLSKEQRRSVKKRSREEYTKTAYQAIASLEKTWELLESRSLADKSRQPFISLAFTAYCAFRGGNLAVSDYPEYVRGFRKLFQRILPNPSIRFEYMDYASVVELRDMLSMEVDEFLQGKSDCYLRMIDRLERDVLSVQQASVWRAILTVWLYRINYAKAKPYPRVKRYWYYFRQSLRYMFSRTFRQQYLDKLTEKEVEWKNRC